MAEGTLHPACSGGKESPVPAAGSPPRQGSVRLRLALLAGVLAAHGLAFLAVVASDPGLPSAAVSRVLQVSWVEGEAADSEAGGSQAGLPQPLEAPAPPLPPRPKATKSAPRPKPKPAMPAKPVAEDAAGERAESTAGQADGAGVAAPSSAASGASGSAAASGSDAAQGGEAGYSAPRFDAAYLSNPAPEYPAVSREMGEEGRVFLRVQVSAEGRPVEIRVHKSSGYDRLDRAALEAVRRWRFIPGHLGGQAIAAQVVVPINFFLQ